MWRRCSFGGSGCLCTLMWDLGFSYVIGCHAMDPRCYRVSPQIKPSEKRGRFATTPADKEQPAPGQATDRPLPRCPLNGRRRSNALGRALSRTARPITDPNLRGKRRIQPLTSVSRNAIRRTLGYTAPHLGHNKQCRDWGDHLVWAAREKKPPLSPLRLCYRNGCRLDE